MVSSSFLQRGQQVGPSMPLFFRFSPKRMLLWAKIQQNISILGMNALVHRYFQIAGLGAAVGIALKNLYPSEAEYFPEM